MRSARLLVLCAILAACGGDSGPVTPTDPDPPDPPPPPPPVSTAIPATLTAARGDQQDASPAAPLSVAPSVVVKDKDGVPLGGILVRFDVDAGGGTVTGDTVRSSATGEATVGSWTLGPLPGDNRLKATAGTVSTTFTATARLAVPTVHVAGTVELPDGATIPPASLRVVTGLAEVPVSATGAFDAVLEPGAVSLAMVEAPNGNPILMGWLGGSSAFSVRSTAQVMAYFDVGAWLSPDTVLHRRAREILAGQVDLGALEGAIAAALAADPGTMNLNTPDVLQARKTVLASLAADVRLNGPAMALINPLGERSGVVVDEVGFRNVSITNNWRRRVVAFVDRVSYRPRGSTNDVDVPAAGAAIRMPAVTPVTSVIGTFIDLLFGNFAWVPVVTPAQSTPLFPVDALSTKYRVTVVGPGRNDPSVTLSQLQAGHRVRASVETMLIDFLVPLIDQMLNAKNLANKFGNQAEIDNYVTKFLDLNPEPMLAAMGNGDWKASFNELFKLIFDSGAGQDLFVEAVLAPYAAERGLSSLRALDAVVERWSRTLAAIEIVATSAAVAQVLRDVSRAEGVLQWDVSVGGAIVKMLPEVAHISQKDIQLFTATVTDATGGGPVPKFMYRWSTTGNFGQLCVAKATSGSNCGTVLETENDRATYAPEVLKEGTDQVKVEVFVKEPAVEIAMGEASASITTYGAKVSITPQQVSIKPSASTTFSATVDTELQDGGVLSYVWSTNGTVGSFLFGQTTGETSIPSITYVAGEGEGNDFVTVTAISTKDGKRRELGSATGAVEVKGDDPGVVSGTLTITDPVPLDAGRQCVAALITIPIPAGTKSLEMHAYGFNDTAFWGKDIKQTFTAPFAVHKPCSLQGWPTNGELGGVYHFMLTGFAGPANSIGGAIATFQSRFAGMVIDVVVKK